MLKARNDLQLAVTEAWIQRGRMETPKKFGALFMFGRCFLISPFPKDF